MAEFFLKIHQFKFAFVITLLWNLNIKHVKDELVIDCLECVRGRCILNSNEMLFPNLIRLRSVISEQLDGPAQQRLHPLLVLVFLRLQNGLDQVDRIDVDGQALPHLRTVDRGHARRDHTKT